MKKYKIFISIALCVNMTACSGFLIPGNWGGNETPACTFGWLQADKGAEFRNVQLLIPNYDGHCYTCFNNSQFNNATFPNNSLNMIMNNVKAGVFAYSTCDFMWKAQVTSSRCIIPPDSIMGTQDDYDSFFCSYDNKLCVTPHLPDSSGILPKEIKYSFTFCMREVTNDYDGHVGTILWENDWFGPDEYYLYLDYFNFPPGGLVGDFKPNKNYIRRIYINGQYEFI